jgi:hypothetical protein
MTLQSSRNGEREVCVSAIVKHKQLWKPCGTHGDNDARPGGGVAGAFGRFFWDRRMDRGSNMFDIRCVYEYMRHRGRRGLMGVVERGGTHMSLHRDWEYCSA